MGIYTKKGDDASTDIIGKRVSKADKRICASGAICQANSFVEASIVFLGDDFLDIQKDLLKINGELYLCCRDLALYSGEDYSINEEMTKYLEARIDDFESKLSPLNSFIRVAKSESTVFLGIANTTTRWAEREFAAHMNENENANINILKYLNRLSDYLFCAACYINKIKEER